MKGFWAALSFLILFGAAPAQAQTYPSRPITLVVPFPPGGSTDAAARIMAERMRATLGQSVIVENMTGASGSLAIARVGRAVPDGYTLSSGDWGTHVVCEVAIALAEAPTAPDTYVVSLCAEADNLSQWRGYGGHAAGVAIGFDRERLWDLARRQDFHLE